MASDSFTGFNNFSNLAITTEGTFTNNSAIDLAGVNQTITANSFNNTGGVVISDTFALSVAGDFDYLANYLGTITTNAFNLQVGGDFSYDDSAKVTAHLEIDSISSDSFVSIISNIIKGTSYRKRKSISSNSSAILKTSCNNTSVA